MRKDDFDKPTKESLAKRAAFICSNPDCKSLTVAPSEEDEKKIIYVGKAAHITAASEGGPRYNATLTSDQRRSISNGIFLCSNCADMIDNNNGADFSVETLKEWKTNHENWITENLNKKIENKLIDVSGEHSAKGIGEVTGIEIKKPTIIRPGTKVSAEGIGKITGTKIG